MTVKELIDKLSEYGDHVPVMIVKPNGRHSEITEVDDAQDSLVNDGAPYVGICFD